jgi:hypothetical protein
VVLTTAPLSRISKHEKGDWGRRTPTLGNTMPKSRHNNTYETRPLILRAHLGATTTLPRVSTMMYKSGAEGWEDPLREQEAWNEPEAVRLLQEAGQRVAALEATGTRMTQRERYHARLVAAHDARDMAAYRMALNGYVEAAREAYRKTKRDR